MQIRGIVFDKDGTLFSFEDTWSAWANRFFLDIADGDVTFADRLGRQVGFDMSTGAFAQDSIVIAGTPDEVAGALVSAIPGCSVTDLVARMNMIAENAPVAEAVPLHPFLTGLGARGLKLGVATNDAEAPARANLDRVGVTGLFDFIAGSDSGYGGKPAPGMLNAFVRGMKIAADQVVMVGDSTHDMLAGRAAGMRTIGVLTGPATADELAALADTVLPDIGHIPAWLDGFSTG